MRRHAIRTVLISAMVGGASLLAACQGQPQATTGTPPQTTTAAKPTGGSPTTGPAASPAASPAAKAAISPAASPARAPSPSPAVSPAAKAAASPAASPARAPSPAVVAASPSPGAGCQFVLGFAQMRDLVGPATVGNCLEDARQIPGNGNTEQRTTNGLLVHRALDGRLLFITANQTWINGPEGLVQRPNNQRFPWEGDRQLVEALQRGGHIVYFRHGATDRSQQDTDPNNLANCTTQRNLTDQGRAQARAVGEAFRALRIPVGQVLSSEYCRALEHARLSFGAATSERSLVLPDPLPQPEREQNTAALQQLLARPPAAGTNTIMVSHSPNIKDAVNVDLPAEGGAAVLRVDEQGRPTLVARVLPEEWTAWAEALARP